MTKEKLIRNSAIGLLQFGLTALLILVSVPVFINKLGLELYGIFAIVSVIGNLNLLTNFGLNGALLVYVSKQGKCRESDHDIIATLFIMFTIMLVFVSIAIIFKESIITQIFSVPQQFVYDAEILLIYLVVANALLLMGQTYTAVIDAEQKIHLSNIGQFVYSLLYWGGMILTVTFGGNLKDIGFVALISAIIWYLIVFVLFRQIWGKLNYTDLKKQFPKVAYKQITYGTKIYLAGFTGFMFEPLSKILLSNFIGVNAVALFEIGTKIKGQINGVFSKAFYPFLPFIANSSDNDKLKKYVFDFTKKIQLIVIPISIVAAFDLPILTRLWLGNENFKEATVFIITLTISMLLLSAPILPVYQYLSAKNKADKNIWIQFSAVLVNLIVFFALYKYTGLYTILISNTLAFVASYLVGNFYQYKYLTANYYSARFYYLKLLAFGIICTLCCLLIRYFVPIGLWDLVFFPLVVTITFIFFIRNQKMINRDDLERYFNSIPFLRIQLTRILIK